MNIPGKVVCAVHMLQWRIIDEKGNKVKSQEVLEMPKWCIHPFSAFSPTTKLLSRKFQVLPSFSRVQNQSRRLYNPQCVCCRPLLPGVPDDDRVLGGAHWFCNSMVCMCGGTA